MSKPLPNVHKNFLSCNFSWFSLLALLFCWLLLTFWLRWSASMTMPRVFSHMTALAGNTRLCVLVLLGFSNILPSIQVHPPTYPFHSSRVNWLTGKLLPVWWLTIIELPSSLLAFTRLRAVLWNMSNTVSFNTQRNKNGDTCIRQGKLAAKEYKNWERNRVCKFTLRNALSLYINI